MYLELLNNMPLGEGERHFHEAYTMVEKESQIQIQYRDETSCTNTLQLSFFTGLTMIHEGVGHSREQHLLLLLLLLSKA